MYHCHHLEESFWANASSATWHFSSLVTSSIEAKALDRSHPPQLARAFSNATEYARSSKVYSFVVERKYHLLQHLYCLPCQLVAHRFARTELSKRR